MALSTKKRVGETQTWPALRDLPSADAAAILTGSTSPHTMTGA
jgi:hypothetical protein